jgi:hypothetical protein
LKAAGSEPDPAAGAALRTARQARELSAREAAQRQLLELGQLLEHSAVPGAGVQQSLLTRALDAYEAAARVLDHAHDITDIAGVLVLVRMGRAAAVAAEAGETVARALVHLCFFNPLHGISARHVRWRQLGQREALVVRACAECADRVHQRRQLDALSCQIDGHEVPYYEVDPRHSVWAATGYGQFTDDLIERVLTSWSVDQRSQ